MAENFVDSMIGDQSSINYRNYHALGENIGSLGAAGKVGQIAKNSSKLVNTGKSGNNIVKNNMPNDTKSTTANSNNNANNWNNNGNDGIVLAGGSETYKRVNNNADLIKDIIENANIQSYTHKQIIRTLEDGTQIIIRKDFGENAHNLGKPFNEKMDHYNLEIQVPFKNGYKTIENIHIIPTEKGYIWYGKDKIIKGE